MQIEEYTNAQASVMALIGQAEQIQAEYNRYDKRYYEALAYEDYAVSESIKNDLNELANRFAKKIEELTAIKALINTYLRK